MMTQKKQFTEIQDQLSALQETPERDPDRAAAGRKEFLARAETYRSQGIRQPVQKSPPSPIRRLRKRWLPTAAGILGALVLALGSVGGTVYASRDSLPDDLLYPVKLAVEDTQLRLENNPQQKLALETAFALRRMDEIQSLIKEGKDIPERATRRLQKHLDRALQQAEQVQNQAQGQSQNQLKSSFQQMDQAMNKLQTENPGRGQEALNLAREKIQQGLEKAGKESSGEDQPRPGQNQDQEHPSGQKPEVHPGEDKPQDPGNNQNQGKGQGQENKPEIPPGQDPDFTPGAGNPHSD